MHFKGKKVRFRKHGEGFVGRDSCALREREGKRNLNSFPMVKFRLRRFNSSPLRERIALHLGWTIWKRAYSFLAISNRWGRIAGCLRRDYPFKHAKPISLSS